MVIHGEGGTGKSVLLQTISRYFETKGIGHRLKKTTYTGKCSQSRTNHYLIDLNVGIAASLIDGQTCHSATMMTHRNSSVSAAARAKLQDIWKNIDYNFTDEISMIGKRFFAHMSNNISIGKTGQEGTNMSFGGISFVVSGDFFQFPPVACSPKEALYWPSDTAHDLLLSQIGRTIYEEFTTVVTLKQQMRVTDSMWQEFLHRLRYGEIVQEDMDLLRSLVLTLPETQLPNFDVEPWKDVVLVTPRHGVREEWNNALIKRHCKTNHHQLLISPIHYEIKGAAIRSETSFDINY